MINLDDLVKHSTIISEKRFLAEVFVHYRAPFSGYVGNKYFGSNIELYITGITHWYDVPEKFREDGDIQCVYCRIVDNLIENRIAKRIVPKEDRMNKYYDSINLGIKSAVIMNKFKLVSLPDYSKIDINNNIHRRYIIEQFISPGDILYEFDFELKQKMDEIKHEYSMGMITGNDAYQYLWILLKDGLDDFNVEKNVDRIIDLNKN